MRAAVGSSSSSAPPLESPFAQLLAVVALLEDGGRAREGTQTRVPTDVLVRLLRAAATGKTTAYADVRALSECVVANGCAAPTPVDGCGGATPPPPRPRADGRGATPPSALALLERLPSAVLGEVYAFLGSRDTLARLTLVSRRLQQRVYMPGGVAHLLVENVAYTLRHLPAQRWPDLRSLCCLRMLRRGWVESWRPLTSAVRRLGPRLRSLHYTETLPITAPLSAADDPYMAPPWAVWPTLRELCYSTSGDMWSFKVGRPVAAPPLLPESLPALKHLYVHASPMPSYDGGRSALARCVGLVEVAAPGRLRDLALELQQWTPACAAALRPHAPFLESLHLSFHANAAVEVPPLTNAHTFACEAVDCVVRVQLAAAPHPRLRLLLLEGQVTLDMAPAPLTGMAPAPLTGGGWRAGALRVLRTGQPTATAARAALTAPGGCGPLDVLCLTECSGDASDADVDAAIDFAVALARETARKLAFAFGGWGDAAAMGPRFARLVTWPRLKEFWIRSRAMPLRTWWRAGSRGIAPHLQWICTYAAHKFHPRPAALPDHIEWRSGGPAGAAQLRLLKKGMAHAADIGLIPDSWPPPCADQYEHFYGPPLIKH